MPELCLQAATAASVEVICYVIKYPTVQILGVLEVL